MRRGGKGHGGMLQGGGGTSSSSEGRTRREKLCPILWLDSVLEEISNGSSESDEPTAKRRERERERMKDLIMFYGCN